MQENAVQSELPGVLNSMLFLYALLCIYVYIHNENFMIIRQTVLCTQKVQVVG